MGGESDRSNLRGSPRKKPRYEQSAQSLEFLKHENAQRCFLRAKVCPDDLNRMIQTQKVFSLYSPITEPFPCARAIPYAGCARARFWKWNKKNVTTSRVEAVKESTEPEPMSQLRKNVKQWLPKLWKIRERVSEFIVEGMMRENMLLSRLDTHRMSKQYRTDTRANFIPSVVRRPFDALGDNEPRTSETRDMRVAVGSEVARLEISGPEQGVDVDWNTVWLEGMVMEEDETSSDSQSTSMAMEEVSAKDVSQDSLRQKKESANSNIFQPNITAAFTKPSEKQLRLRPLDLSDRLVESKLKLQATGVTCCRVRGQRRKTVSINPKANPLVFSVTMGLPPNVPLTVARVIPAPLTLPPCASPLDTLAFAACSAAASAEASTANSAAPSPAMHIENLGELIEKAMKTSPPARVDPLQQQLGLLTFANVVQNSTEEANGNRVSRNSIERNHRQSVAGQGLGTGSLEERRTKFHELVQKIKIPPRQPQEPSLLLSKKIVPSQRPAKPSVQPLGLLQAADWFAHYGLEAEYSPPANETEAPRESPIPKSVISSRATQRRTQDITFKKKTKNFGRDYPVDPSSSPRKREHEKSSKGALTITTSPEMLRSPRKIVAPISEEVQSPSGKAIVCRALPPEEKISPNSLSLVQKKDLEEMYDAMAAQDAMAALNVSTRLGDVPKTVTLDATERQRSETLMDNRQQTLPAGTVTQRINLEEFPTVSAKKRGRPRKHPIAPVTQELPVKQKAEAISKTPHVATELVQSHRDSRKGIYTAAAEEKHLPFKKRKVSYSTDPEQGNPQPSPKKGRGRPPKTAARLEHIPEDSEKIKSLQKIRLEADNERSHDDAAGISTSLVDSPRGKRRSGKQAESPGKTRRYGIRNKLDETVMPAPVAPEQPDTGYQSSTAGRSRDSSVADDSASERTSFSSSYANMKTDNKYMMAPKKYLLRRAQTEQAEEPVPEPNLPLSDPVAHQAVIRQPSQDDIRCLTPPPPETSPDIVIIEPPEKTPEEVKREVEEPFEEPVLFQVTDYEYDEDGVDDPPVGAPVIYACDFSVIDKGQGLNLDWAPFPPDSARVDATCFSHLVLNLARGQKFSILPRMTNRYSLIRDEYDLLMFIIEDAEVNPMYLKDDNYTLACEDPRALFEQAVIDLSRPCLRMLTRDKDPVLAKKQVLTSYKIREVIDVFLKKKNEMLIGLANEAFGHTDGPEFQLLQEQFEQVMKAIQIRMCDNLLGLAEETRQWDPTVNTLKRRFETFLFGWRSFIHQGGPIKCFYERFRDEMHPRVAETTNKCISITETYTRKIASFLQEGPVTRVNQLVENFERDRKVFTDKFQRSIINVETTRSASHRHGCRDPCNIFFSEVDLLDYHKELHTYKPYDCNICYLSFSHELSLYLHYLERHTIDVLSRDIRIAS